MKSIPISIIVNTGYRHSSYLHFLWLRGGHKAILHVNTEVNIYIYTSGLRSSSLLVYNYVLITSYLIQVMTCGIYLAINLSDYSYIE